MVIMGEFADLLNMSSSSAESVKNSLDVNTILHGDNSQLIFFIAPNKESFSIVMENTSSRWPVSVQVGSGKIFISLLEKEVIGNQLILSFLIHGGKTVVSSFKITLPASLLDLVSQKSKDLKLKRRSLRLALHLKVILKELTTVLPPWIRKLKIN
jgi:hypothetical protein